MTLGIVLFLAGALAFSALVGLLAGDDWTDGLIMGAISFVGTIFSGATLVGLVLIIKAVFA